MKVIYTAVMNNKKNHCRPDHLLTIVLFDSLLYIILSLLGVSLSFISY